MTSIQLTEYGGPEVLRIVEAPVPVPAEGELLVRMKAAGVSKPDVLMRTGTYPWTKDILPFYPGLYGAGVVEAVGPGVAGFAPGDPVFVDHPVKCGCYSTMKTIPADYATKLPEGVDFKEAAALNNHFIAWSLLTDVCQPADGKTLYIKGAAGALGSALVQLAPLAGLTVIASASTPEKCDYLRSLGVERVFCYRETEEAEAVLRLTDGLGADFILDQCVGEEFGKQLPMLNRKGTIIVYNTLNGFPSQNVIQLLTDNFAKCPAVRAFSFHLHDGRFEELHALRGQVFRFLAEGRFRPYVGAVYPQDQVVAAHQRLAKGDFFGTIVLEIP